MCFNFSHLKRPIIGKVVHLFKLDNSRLSGVKSENDVEDYLHQVCIDLHDPTVRLNEAEIMVGVPFRAMLGQRAVIGEVEKIMNNQDFYIETKIDGERMQVHKNGDEFSYFSRNCIEYTGNFIDKQVFIRLVIGNWKSLIDGQF